MNSMMREYYPTFEMYQALRSQLMEILADEDLAFQPGGGNAPLGELCREIGETEMSYIQSFKTFTQDFSQKNEEPEVGLSVKKLVYPIPHTVYPIPHNVYPIPYTLSHVPYTLYPIPYTQYRIPYTVSQKSQKSKPQEPLPEPYALHLTP